MKFIYKLKGFLSYAKDVTFIWMEAHKPIVFPSCSCIKVLLKVSSIIKVHLFVYDNIICKCPLCNPSVRFLTRSV